MTYSTILHALGWLHLLLAGAMLVPWTVALYSGETASFIAFSLAILLTGFCGGAMGMAFRDVKSRASKTDLFALVISAWLVVPLFAALPLYVSGALTTFTDAYFEALSGFTTTGASVISVLDEMDRAVLVWRAVLQWLGGWASIVMGAAVLAPLGVGGMELRLSPLTRADKSRSFDRFPGTAKAIGTLYASFTAVCFLLVWAGGVPAFDAFCLSLSAISTGGFTPTDAGLGGYDAPWSMVFLAVFMIVGAINFATHRAAIRGRSREYEDDPENTYLVTMILGGGVLLAIVALQDTGDIIQAALGGMFTAVSLVTGTGFVAPGEGVMGGIPPILVIGLVMVGGATLSTSGGIKLMRIAMLLKQGGRELKRLTHPHGIISTQFAGRPLAIPIMKSVWTFFCLFLFAFAVLAILLSATGLPFEAALLSAASAIANVGPAYDLVRLGGETLSPAYADMTDGAKWLLMAGMVVGRLELLAFIALFSREYWRS